MGFSGSSCTFTRYRIADPVPEILWPQIPERLRRNAFQDIDELPEERSFGWTSFDDMLDTTWSNAPPEKGEYLAFALRLESRRLPPAVLKKHCALALRDEKRRMAEQGKNFISRERKKELRDQVHTRLLMRFLPVPAVFDVLWACRTGIVLFATTQRKMLDMFEDIFTRTFDLNLDQLTPYGLAAASLAEHETDKLAFLETTNFA